MAHASGRFPCHVGEPTKRGGGGCGTKGKDLIIELSVPEWYVWDGDHDRWKYSEDTHDTIITALFASHVQTDLYHYVQSHWEKGWNRETQKLLSSTSEQYWVNKSLSKPEEKLHLVKPTPPPAPGYREQKSYFNFILFSSVLKLSK